MHNLSEQKEHNETSLLDERPVIMKAATDIQNTKKAESYSYVKDIYPA